MGALTSRPKIPTPQPVQIVQTPTVTAPVASTPAPASSATALSGGGSEESASSSSEVSAQEQRTNNLLRRDRSRLGTIQTSLRGLLGLSDNESGRKTLLGE